MLMMKRLSVLCLVGMLCSCGDEAVVDDPQPEEPWDNGNNPFASGKEDGWDWINDPERFGRFLDEALEYRLEALPLEGVSTQLAWPETYWPTYADSTNARWLNPDEWSPLEKYDFVFNGWVPPEGFDSLRPMTSSTCVDQTFDLAYYDALGPAARWQSENRGHWSGHDGIDNDGDGLIDECTDLDGIDTWWGLCHAWTPAAMLEQEPVYPVVIDGVTFYPSDIKALMITIYDYSRGVVIGGRCRTDQVERDENGRILDPDCRDTNAGAFHVIVANFLGRYGTAIAEDRTYDDQVWNQPVHSYEVDRIDEVDETAAIALVIDDPTGVDRYPHNDEARRWAEVEVTVRYVTESVASTEPRLPEHASHLRTDRYHYLLELDADGLIIGGEWIQGGANGPLGGFSNQPDFLWFPIGPVSNPQPTAHAIPDPRRNPELSLPTVRDLIERAQTPP